LAFAISVYKRPTVTFPAKAGAAAAATASTAIKPNRLNLLIELTSPLRDLLKFIAS
jgi:hypothetical protein